MIGPHEISPAEWTKGLEYALRRRRGMDHAPGYYGTIAADELQRIRFYLTCSITAVDDNRRQEGLRVAADAAYWCARKAHSAWLGDEINQYRRTPAREDGRTQAKWDDSEGGTLRKLAASVDGSTDAYEATLIVNRKDLT